MKINQTVLLAFLATNFTVAQANEAESCHGMATGTSVTQSDTNKDNVVSLDEYLTTEKNNATNMFKHIDANGDGKLDAAEQKVIDQIMQGIAGAHSNKNDKQKNISI